MYVIDSRITATNPFFKFIQTMLIVSWLIYRIVVVNLHLSGKLGAEVPYLLTFENRQWKTSSGIKYIDLAGPPVEPYLSIYKFGNV